MPTTVLTRDHDTSSARGATSVRDLLRAAREAIDAPLADGTDAPLEIRYTPAGPPRIVSARALEPDIATRVIPGEPIAMFGGFLDGVQESRVVTWLPSGVPLVVGVVGAVILERGADRRLTAWGDGARVRRVCVLPRALVDPTEWGRLEEQGLVEDSGATSMSHPDSLLTSAVEQVERLRADHERVLADAWASRESRPLAVDGGISSYGTASRSDAIVGIVKSHRTLYVDVHALPSLFALEVGARTPAFVVESSSGRASVHSWYLRLRPPTAANPMHGMVRVEVSARNESAVDTTARVDDVSRWVLAERTPIALPDARWDVMSYGIARCESYLKRGLALRARE